MASAGLGYVHGDQKQSVVSVPGTSPHIPCSCAGSEEPQGQQKQPVVSVRRKITCPTYCSRLHVTQDMAEHLLPRYTEGSTTKVRPAWLHPAAPSGGSTSEVHPGASFWRLHIQVAHCLAAPCAATLEALHPRSALPG